MPNLLKRILSGLALFPFVIGAVFFIPSIWSALMACLIATQIGFEYATISMGKKYFPRRLMSALFSGLACAAVAFYPLFSYGPVIAMGAIPVFAFLSFMFSRDDFENTSPASAFMISGSFYCGSLIGFMGLIFNTFNSLEGSAWVFLLILGTFSCDTFAYAFGRLFGKIFTKKLAPRISPKKTWIGAFGGLVGAAFGVSFCKYFWLHDVTWLEVLCFSPFFSILCQVGDLAESSFKRGFGVKDSGNLIPGHGGLLDRCDALMFGAPLVFLFSVFR